jgi:dTDP-glucose 4,6-dehydratase
MKPTILITGSTGFIFSNFIRKAIFDKIDYKLVSVDKITNKQLFGNVYFNKSHDFSFADINDSHVLDCIFDFHKPDYVIHAAAESSVDHSLHNPNEFIKTNVLGTQNVINSSIKYGVKKVLYMSTDEVYGQLQQNDQNTFKETDVIAPRNPYAASKACGELLFQSAQASFGLNNNIVRCCNNMGPRQTVDKLIPKTINSILNKKPIDIYGDGLFSREWIHTADTSSAILKVLEDGDENEVYNIGTGNEMSVLDIVGRICKIMNEGYDLINHIPCPRKTAHDIRYAVDSSKIRKLGWEPKVKFNDAIQQTVDWYINNKWFFNLR